MVENVRLVIAPSKMHFSQWEIEEFQKYFHTIQIDSPSEVKPNDILFVYAWAWANEFSDVKCKAKFCMLYPGFGFRPMNRMRVMRRKHWPTLEKYTAIFANKGPAWQVLQHYPTGYLVPYSAANQIFRKTRNRERFQRIVQVARNVPFKGRSIAEAAMQLMPYDWEILPKSTKKVECYNMVPWSSLPNFYEQADGFICTSKMGPHEIDAKYNQATMEAGLSGCIIFWHDCMKLGNDFETVFPISLDPHEIAQTIQDVVNSIDLEKHSLLTSQEFYEKCNVESAIRARVEIMKRFL